MELIKSTSVLLPFLAFSGSWLALRRRGQDWRTSFLVSATLWGVWIAVTTELLSVGSLLTRGAVAAAWLAASILAWFFALFARKSQQVSATSGSPAPDPSGDKHVDWYGTEELKMGDELRVRLISSDTPDPPLRYRTSPRGNPDWIEKTKNKLR